MDAISEPLTVLRVGGVTPGLDPDGRAAMALCESERPSSKIAVHRRGSAP
jgi:hypothetical protein